MHSLEINTDDLDGELIHFPQEFYDAALASAQSESVRDEKKSVYEYTLSVMDITIRERMLSSGTKCTEVALRAIIDTDDTVRAAQEAYLSAKKDAADATAFLEALIHKGKMLQKLTDLYISRGRAIAGDHVYAATRTAMADKRKLANSKDV